MKVFVAPTIKFHVWRVAIQTEQHDYVGTARWKDVEFTDKVKRQSMTPDITMESRNKDIFTFLNFSSVIVGKQHL